MTESLLELTGLARATLFAGFIVFIRVGAAMALLPAFGERMIPIRVRLVLTLAFTVIVAPAVAPLLPETTDPLANIGSEAVIGLALGATVRLFIMALQIMGSIAAQSVSLAQIFGGQAVDALPAIGHVISLAGLTLAILFDLHIRISEMLIQSYILFPPGAFPDPSEMVQWGVARVGASFALGFSLAAPFVISSVVYNIALGAINRAMPQLMVAFVGAPAITAGGMVLLALSLPFALQIWIGTLDRFLDAPFEATR